MSTTSVNSEDIEVTVCVSWMKLNVYRTIKIGQNDKVGELREKIGEVTCQPASNIELFGGSYVKLFDCFTLQHLSLLMVIWYLLN